ncbi:hypothetical protein VNI00_003207 [Paramarasmius palmivorus]|uniref:SMP domain-containing protein n=1 Tax=Paramarasmius palmivorus TaxID=297713 RepID=A0AAW0DTX5_9AGAR
MVRALSGKNVESLQEAVSEIRFSSQLAQQRSEGTTAAESQVQVRSIGYPGVVDGSGVGTKKEMAVPVWNRDVLRHRMFSLQQLLNRQMPCSRRRRRYALQLAFLTSPSTRAPPGGGGSAERIHTSWSRELLRKDQSRPGIISPVEEDLHALTTTSGVAHIDAQLGAVQQRQRQQADDATTRIQGLVAKDQKVNVPKVITDAAVTGAHVQDVTAKCVEAVNENPMYNAYDEQGLIKMTGSSLP